MDWTFLLQRALVVVIDILLPVLLTAALVAVRQWWQKTKTEKLAAQSKIIEDTVRSAIKAAEQLGVTGDLKEFADSKLDYVLKLASAELKEHYGIDLDLGFLRSRIEAIVWDEFGWTKRNDGAAALRSALGGDSIGKGAA